MITCTACTPTVLASSPTETPQSGRSGHPCTLPASAGSPGNRTISHGSLLHRMSYSPGPAPGSGDHPQPPQQATSRPSSPLAAAQSSCHELISSTCFPPRKLGKPRPPTLLWQRVWARNPSCQEPETVITGLSPNTEGHLGWREERAARVSSPIRLLQGDKYLLFLL